jgi:hypothetical protein
MASALRLPISHSAMQIKGRMGSLGGVELGTRVKLPQIGVHAADFFGNRPDGLCVHRGFGFGRLGSGSIRGSAVH